MQLKEPVRLPGVHVPPQPGSFGESGLLDAPSRQEQAATEAQGAGPANGTGGAVASGSPRENVRAVGGAGRGAAYVRAAGRVLVLSAGQEARSRQGTPWPRFPP